MSHRSPETLSVARRTLVSIGKKIIAAILVLAIVAVVGYGLFSLGGANNNRGEGGLRSPDVRTIVTLSVVGGSAFITGFGLRDAIGRAVAMRQRRLKSAGAQKPH